MTDAAIMYELQTQYIFRENSPYISEAPEEFSYIICIYISKAALTRREHTANKSERSVNTVEDGIQQAEIEKQLP